MSDDAYSQEISRANWLIDAGQDKRAMEILARLLADYPDNTGLTYTILAVAHNAADRLEESEAAARRAIAAAPNSPEAHGLLAHTLIFQNREPEAEPALRTALQLEPQNHLLHNLMAMALTRMDRNDEALFYAREAVGLSPETADHHAMMAMAQMKTNPQAAKASLQDAFRLNPLCEDALFIQFYLLNSHTKPHEAAKALAAYIAHASHSVMVRTAADSFLIKFMTTVHLGQFWCALLTVILLPLVALTNLPNGILLIPLILTAIIVCRATIARILSCRHYFKGRCLRMLRACIRNHRYLALWSLALPPLWLGLVIGVIRAVQGDNIILISVAGASIVHLALGWAGHLLRPLIRRRNA